MCQNCRAFVSIDDRVCPYCDTKLSARTNVTRTEQAAGGLFPTGRFVTSMILLINVALYGATMLLAMQSSGGGLLLDIDGQTLALFGAKVRSLIFAGEWWRLVTAGFLHGGLLHILMNSWVLFDVGAQVEDAYGASRYVVIYFVATILGFLASTFWSPALSIGASAGIFGLVGAMIAFGTRNQSAAASALRGHYTQWVVYMLVIGLLPIFRVDLAAHLGGLAGGFGVGYIAGIPSIFDSFKERIWPILAGVCLLLTLASFALMFLGFLAE